RRALIGLAVTASHPCSVGHIAHRVSSPGRPHDPTSRSRTYTDDLTRPHVIVDCCTRQVTGWTVDVRTRTTEAIGCVEAAVLAHGIVPKQLTLGTDNGSQFTSR